MYEVGLLVGLLNQTFTEIKKLWSLIKLLKVTDNKKGLEIIQSFFVYLNKSACVPVLIKVTSSSVE